MSDNFLSKLKKSIAKRDSLLCVGLDPQMDIAFEDDVVSVICEFNRKIIEQTAEYAACYKPNIAFYEQFGPEGVMALKKSLDLIPADIPVIIDAKRSDIGNTAKAYAKALFGDYNADAVTLNAYLGRESVEPFLEYGGRGLFLLCRTSNPGSAVFQTPQVTAQGRLAEEFFLHLATEVTGWSQDIGLVVAGNDPAALRAVRARLPGTWLLAPGIGAQGGTVAEAVEAGLGQEGHNLLLNVSRGISLAPLPGRKARELRDEINRARSHVIFSVPDPVALRKKALVRGIIEAGCFQVGSFKVKSGAISPFYIDLRKLGSLPGLLHQAAAAYAEAIAGIAYDRVAGIPLAGLPIATALALRENKPLVYPRMQQKQHGTGNTIEGLFAAGEKVVLVDDLITTGKSKLEACQVLQDGGLVVEDLVVLIERGSQGRRDMEQAGIRLHACLGIEDLLAECRAMGLVDEAKLAEIHAFVQG